jgi:hypothetical protein
MLLVNTVQPLAVITVQPPAVVTVQPLIVITGLDPVICRTHCAVTDGRVRART